MFDDIQAVFTLYSQKTIIARNINFNFRRNTGVVHRMKLYTVDKHLCIMGKMPRWL